MIRAIVFDLDKCLAPPEEIGRGFFEPALEAIRQANNGLMRDDVLEEAFGDFWHLAYDEVASRHGFSDEMKRAGWEVFREFRMPGPLNGYGDLDVLRDFQVPLLLVTTGFRSFQQSKVDALGIRERFAEVIVDAIDESERLGKQRIFAGILERFGWRPDEVLVVGDNPESEIDAGNRLGMPTVQILRPGVVRGEGARSHVRTLAELRKLMSHHVSRG